MAFFAARLTPSSFIKCKTEHCVLYLMIVILCTVIDELNPEIPLMSFGRVMVTVSEVFTWYSVLHYIINLPLRNMVGS